MDCSSELGTLKAWCELPELTPVLDLRPEARFIKQRLIGTSCNIPLGELYRRMFLLPPPKSPFAVILPSTSDYHIVREEQEWQNWKDHKKPSVGSTSIPVYLKGFETLQDFLTSRSSTVVTWVLLDSEKLWEAAAQLSLIEGPAEDSEAVARLRRRFLFKPCPLLEQSIGLIESQLAERHYYRLKEKERDSESEISKEALAKQSGSLERHQVRLLCLEPGCGSGRNLAWLAARHNEVVLSCGSVVEVSWDVIGLDFWYGALERLQGLCQILGISPEQCSLIHCEIEQKSATLQPVSQPVSSRSNPQSHIQGPPADGSLPGHIDLLLCVRFLHRSLNVKAGSFLSEGGFVLYNTFLDLEGVREFGRPRGSDHLLQPSELREQFSPERGFQVLNDEIEIEDQHCRELSLFLAQRL